MTVQPKSALRVRPADLARLREHPAFRTTVESYCAASLVRYQSLDSIERWMLSDNGRASLSGVATVLGGSRTLTARALLNSAPVTAGLVSRGRVRLYLERALANGLFSAQAGAAAGDLDAPLVLSPRFYAVMLGVLAVTLDAVGLLAPEVQPARARLKDPTFATALSIKVGMLAKAQSDLFPQGGPVQLFQSRDGGARLLEFMVLRQPADRTRLLEACDLSRAALAGSAFCSRVHVSRLLADQEARGHMSVQGRTLTFAPAFSDAVESYFAAFFAVTVVTATATATLAQG